MSSNHLFEELIMKNTTAKKVKQKIPVQEKHLPRRSVYHPLHL